MTAYRDPWICRLCDFQNEYETRACCNCGEYQSDPCDKIAAAIVLAAKHLILAFARDKFSYGRSEAKRLQDAAEINGILPTEKT